ncbi:RING finger 32 isoform X1 [Brachionus plicatilis]|uniref:RING finger 32 isoform X1 n=1 Tax=Brachionus plicatilis TaxID=10195 RepID=A0A3M7SWZ4_BRAPC|nr:RING finger 32 isoform X1 [Brachionus plicatilis]
MSFNCQRANLKKPDSITKALVSTAFQDHISKQLELDSLVNLNFKKPISRNKICKLDAKSKVDSGLSKNIVKKKTFNDEKEYVLTKATAADLPTLAEKLGLVGIDDSRKQIGETEWNEIKIKYKNRQEFKEPCVICKEPLGINQQVLLSCTHTFHRNCLEMFEKHSGKKACPMCRKERYKARVVYDASRYHKNVSASKIQAAWRGYLVRKWYKNYRKMVPPKNPILRKKFFEEKLSDITNRLIQSFNYDADNLLEDIEKNLKKSRETFKNFDERYRHISEEEWSSLLTKVINRNHDECSICMNKYNLPCSIFDLEKCLDQNEAKPIVLLSCSHLFHSVCLNTFEELNLDKINVCPECRSAYRKREISTFFNKN